MSFDPISYLKAKEAKELADNIVDGEVDKGVLRTNIDQKLNDLEEEYASKLEEVPSKEEVETTSRQSWSTANDILITKTNNEQRVIHGSPNFERKKILVIGSSIALGRDATKNNGWANRLKAIMEPRGYTVVNRAISGNSTQQVINRFYKDVVPDSPDFVVISLSLGNEGIQNQSEGNKESIYLRYKNNMLRLINMCRQHGFIPIIGSNYARKGFNEVDYTYARTINEIFDNMGIAQFDFMNAFNEYGTAKILPILDDGDGLHPNDIGHEAILRAIPFSIFDNLAVWNGEISSQDSGRVKTGTDRVTGVRPIQLVLTDPVESFTVGFKLKDLSSGIAKAYFGFGISTNRIRSNNNLIEYTSNLGSLIESSVRLDDSEWHHIAFSHDKHEAKTRLYIDGMYIGETDEDVVPTNFTIAGNSSTTVYYAVDCEYKDFSFHRTRLDEEQISDLAKGSIPKSSLEVFSPLSDRVVSKHTHFMNLAPNSSYLKVNVPDLKALW